MGGDAVPLDGLRHKLQSDKIRQCETRLVLPANGNHMKNSYSSETPVNNLIARTASDLLRIAKP